MLPSPGTSTDDPTEACPTEACPTEACPTEACPTEAGQPTEFQARNREMKRRTLLVDEMMSRRNSATASTMLDGFEQQPQAEVSGEMLFTQADKSVFVFSTCHIGVPPLVRSPTEAGVRLYGGFGNRDEAMEYAVELSAKDPDCSVQIGLLQSWIIACNTLERIEDVAYTDAKRQSLLEGHTSDLIESKAAFEQYKHDPDRLRTRDDVQDLGHDNAAPVHAGPAREGQNGTQPAQTAYTRRFDRSMEIRAQNFAVVSIVPDTAPDGEFAFCVWAFFETEAQCDVYVRQVAGAQVKDHAMHVVSLYEWVKPTKMGDDSEVPVHYRSKELDSIMKHSRQHKRDVSAFKDWCKNEGADLPVIEA